MAQYKFSRAQNRYAVLAGRRIKICREAMDWTQEDLSKATQGKLSATRIANYEQGIRELSIQPAIWLGEALKQPPAFLLGVVDEVDRDLLLFPMETKMHMLAAFKAVGTKT